MLRNNHLIVHSGTNMHELESVIEEHGDTISYIKIASAHRGTMDIKRVCSMVRGSAISVCMGGGLAEQEAGQHYTRIGRFLGDDTRSFRNLVHKGVDAIELPAEFLSNAELVARAKNFFRRILVEVGVKDHCSYDLNAVSCMLAGIQRAQELGADHIVLEGSAAGDCGIYHSNGTPNILVVYSLMQQFSDRTQCIIEAPMHAQQDVWRALFGPETHIGNIYRFNQINVPVSNRIPDGYWNTIGQFIQKLQALSDSLGLSWDDVSRIRELNVDIIYDFPRLSSFSDAALEEYLKGLPLEGFEGFPTEIPMVVQIMLDSFLRRINQGGFH